MPTLFIKKLADVVLVSGHLTGFGYQCTFKGYNDHIFRSA